MRCLTQQEISEWLARQGMPEDPYGHPRHGVPLYYLQFATPADEAARKAFVREYFLKTGPAGVLIHATDWSGYRPQDMATLVAVRARHGELRWLIDAPGHLFAA
ncbi:MAG: hypothetical protein JWO82_302, partial [Akkermansiaceae bacterium]|nr:hypothetical protein [Akkermansiaceae bacterium]